ncbi:neutral sphingomyelinase [Oratosquilla oratoria]|uniref:neutral sphingomyelinase n=1 Tax=Oratosquilla oratoria TaxID=337810 RepID=UPI003F75AD8B
MAIEIKVLTLNVWGIPGISKNRKARIEAISSQLASGPDLYDFVFLQELWSKDDYRFIADKVSRVLPYSHPFYSGVLGSGIVVFSKAPFTDIHFHAFSLNGYAHAITHGDWWGGKGVGMCRVTHHGINFNLVTTHCSTLLRTLRDASTIVLAGCRQRQDPSQLNILSFCLFEVKCFLILHCILYFCMFCN